MSNIFHKLSSNGLVYINDIKDVDSQFVLHKIKTNTQFSFSFIVLLVVSSIVSTLGLLLNTPAIIIGGMIISPLMWPLMKISIGVSIERKSFIKQAISLLLLSIGISIFSSFFISSISPIKHLNNEILARTTPTILDIFVALAAGTIAAMALIQKKISDSLAGVAIATSLMPPLCVAGIGLSFYSLPTFSGGFLLFLANVVSIIFSAILVFIFVGIKKNNGMHLQLKGILTISIALFITAIPLVIAMKNYSFKVNAYDKTQKILTSEFNKISPDIYVQNIITNLESEGRSGAITINAELLIPEDLNINYQQKEEIIAQLEKTLGKKIDLNLRIQKTINLVSEKDLVTSKTKNILIKTVREEIPKIDSGITVDTITCDYNQTDKIWTVEVILRSDPSIQFSQNSRSEIEQTLIKKINNKVNLNIDVISRLKLKSQPDLENDQIKKDIQSSINAISEDIDLVSLNLISDPAAIDKNNKAKILITLDLRIPQGMNFSNNYINLIKNQLQNKYKKELNFKVNIIEKRILQETN